MKLIKKASSVEAYIHSFPLAICLQLKQLRKIIVSAAPKAEERMSYSMPAYFLNGPLVYFGAYEKHIGFYPTPSAIVTFEKELALYKHAKGSVQFPLDKPLPVALIKKMVLFKVKESKLK